jgi:hypothetical protein
MIEMSRKWWSAPMSVIANFEMRRALIQRRRSGERPSG